jgi:hypothetical protein
LLAALVTTLTLTRSATPPPQIERHTWATLEAPGERVDPPLLGSATPDGWCATGPPGHPVPRSRPLTPEEIRRHLVPAKDRFK